VAIPFELFGVVYALLIPLLLGVITLQLILGIRVMFIISRCGDALRTVILKVQPSCYPSLLSKEKREEKENRNQIQHLLYVNR